MVFGPDTEPPAHPAPTSLDAVHDRHGAPLAMFGFSTAARKLAPRDSFIGWTPQQREKNLPLVIDNPSILILPWIVIPNLGSHILSLVRRQLPDDWTERYNAHRDLRRGPASPARSTRRRAGSMSEPPRDAADTTATPDGINRRRTSGSAPSEKTGGER